MCEHLHQPIHSTEPWHIDERGAIRDARGYVVCGPPDYPNDAQEPTKTDAERIVACINACRGIATDDLTAPTGPLAICRAILTKGLRRIGPHVSAGEK